MTGSEKTAAAALVFAGVSLVTTLVRGVPEPPAREAAREALRVRAAAGTQTLALDADRKDLNDLERKIAALAGQFDDARRVDSAETERRLGGLAEMEMEARAKVPPKAGKTPPAQEPPELLEPPEPPEP
jgi:hypothetical protein